jgi:hypothetical protein
MCMIVSHILKLLMMFGLSFAILMRALLKLSHLIRTLIIGNIKPFSQKAGESLDYCFARFEAIVSNLRACGRLAYINNERAKQLLYALDDHVWGMKITALEESADFATLDTEKLFSKLKSHELSCKGHPNHDALFTSKSLITSARVGGHDANPANTVSSSLEFALSSLAAASEEQYESIPDDEIALLARKFRAMHRLRKERRRDSQNSRGCFECGDTIYFIVDCPKRKNYDYSNKNDYNNKNDYKKKNRFEDKMKKNINKIMFQACAALSDFDFSYEDSSSSKEDEKISYKKKEDDFTGLCLMTKGGSSWNDSDSNSDVSDDLTYDGLSSKVHKLENALCSQDKFLFRVFLRTKILILSLKTLLLKLLPSSRCTMI